MGGGLPSYIGPSATEWEDGCGLYSRFATKLPPPPRAGGRVAPARPKCRAAARQIGRSIARAGFRVEVLIELTFDTLEIVGVRRRFLLLGDVRPLGRIFRVELEPLLETALGVGQDRLG